MSNIGKKSIQIKEGVQVTIENNLAKVTGPKGSLEARIPEGIGVEIKDGIVFVKKNVDIKENEKYFGLIRSLINNMILGVKDGFEKKLELSGVGYRAKIEGGDLILNVGFAVPVRVKPPEGINFQVVESTIIVSGINKELVGNIASKIREVRVPDPYKGKGIKYLGEKLRRKVGKAAKAVGGK